MSDTNLSRAFYSGKQLAERYGVHETTIWRWTQQGLLPKPKRIGPRTTRWVGDELAECEAERRAQEVA